jgi:UPF0716 protein FxsA
VVAWLLFLFVAVPIVEIYVIAKVAFEIGAPYTVLLLVLFSAAGAWLVKHEGLAMARRVRTGLRAGQMPSSEVVDGLLILLAGVLMLTPGFVTTATGLVLLLPPARAAVRGLLTHSLAKRVSRHIGLSGDVTGGHRPTWQPGWAEGPDPSRSGPSTDRGPRPGPTGPGAGRRRPYRRPGEPDPESSRVWGARVRDPATPDSGVIDIDGEEIVFPDSGPELGPHTE